MISTIQYPDFWFHYVELNSFSETECVDDPKVQKYMDEIYSSMKQTSDTESLDPPAQDKSQDESLKAALIKEFQHSDEKRLTAESRRHYYDTCKKYQKKLLLTTPGNLMVIQITRNNSRDNSFKPL